MKKRCIAFFLSALMIGSALTVLSSCSDKDKPGSSSGPGSGSGGSGATTTGTGETPPQLKPGVPDGVRFDTDGEKIPLTFAVANMGDNLMARSIKLDADDVDANNKVDVAVAARNAIVEDQLGIEIVPYVLDTGTLTGSMVVTALAAGSDEFDVLCGSPSDDLGLYLEGMLVNLNDMTDDSGSKIDYLSFGKPWWPEYYNNAMTFDPNVSRYWVTGDLSLRYSSNMYCFIVNEKLYEQDLHDAKSDVLSQKYGTDTTYGDIYDLVRKGDWTLDVLTEMVAKAYRDDGDGKADTAEVWGMSTINSDIFNALAVSAGVEYSERTADGKINLLFTSGNTRLVDYMAKMRTLLNSNQIQVLPGTNEADKQVLDELSNDQVAFASSRLCNTETYLSNSVADYYIIPTPKLNFDQREYRSALHLVISAYGISSFSKNKAAAAAALELMGYYSYQDVRPVYYDQALKNMYTTDADSAEMIDLMHDNIYADFVYIWGKNSNFNAGGTMNLRTFLNHVEYLSGTSSAARLSRYEESWKAGLEKLVEDIQEYEAKE